MKKAFTLACLLGLSFCAPKWHELDVTLINTFRISTRYTPGSAEYASKKMIFEDHIAQIMAFNRDSS